MPSPDPQSSSAAVFTSVDRPRQVSAHIADQIRARIHDGSLPVGARLPTEAELAEQFGVSRPSVREALAALQFVGLVESRRGFGTVVVALGPDSVDARRGRPREQRAVLTSLDQAVDVFEARLHLEPAALSVAALDPDPEALAIAGELIDGMGVAVDDPQLHASTDIRVHHALLDTCRNTMLREAARELLEFVFDPILDPSRQHAWSSHDHPHDWALQHRRVHSALVAGDAAAARLHSRAHLAAVMHTLAEVLGDEPARRRVHRILRSIEEAPDGHDS